MSELAKPSSSFELAEMLEAMVLGFRGVLENELAEIGPLDDKTSGSLEDRMKSFTDFMKIIQGIEFISNGIRQQREHDNGRQIEVVEFRRQLEEQIARLVDNETSENVSGTTE